MKVRVLLLVFFLLPATCVWSAASPFSDAAARLNGEWRGDGFVLRVDAKRAQASLDVEHPFAWQHFLIKEVTSDEVVFTVGAELYEAEVADDTLSLTGTSFRGTRVLFREHSDLRGSVAE